MRDFVIVFAAPAASLSRMNPDWQARGACSAPLGFHWQTFNINYINIEPQGKVPALLSNCLAHRILVQGE